MHRSSSLLSVLRNLYFLSLLFLLLSFRSRVIFTSLYGDSLASYLFISALVTDLQLEPLPWYDVDLVVVRGSSTSEASPLSEANRCLLTDEWLCPSIRIYHLTDLIQLSFRFVGESGKLKTIDALIINTRARR